MIMENSRALPILSRRRERMEVLPLAKTRISSITFMSPHSRTTSSGQLQGPVSCMSRVDA